MARQRQFDPDTALDGAIGVFSEHGYEGASAQMLVEAMGIGRQSLYDTFGDKWQLYCAALRRYASGECAAHFAELRKGPRALDGIAAMLERVVKTASFPCLGVGSIYEFGTSRPDLDAVNKPLGQAMQEVLTARIRDAQREGDVSPDLDAASTAGFLMAMIASIRVTGRGGSGLSSLNNLASMALRALR